MYQEDRMEHLSSFFDRATVKHFFFTESPKARCFSIIRRRPWLEISVEGLSDNAEDLQEGERWLLSP